MNKMAHMLGVSFSMIPYCYGMINACYLCKIENAWKNMDGLAKGGNIHVIEAYSVT